MYIVRESFKTQFWELVPNMTFASKKKPKHSPSPPGEILYNYININTGTQFSQNLIKNKTKTWLKFHQQLNINMEDYLTRKNMRNWKNQKADDQRTKLGIKRQK